MGAASPPSSHAAFQRLVVGCLAARRSRVLPGVARKVWAAPLGNMGRNAHAANRWLGTTRGMTDLLTWWEGGRFLGIELKFRGDTLSPAQKATLGEFAALGFDSMVFRAGGGYRLGLTGRGRRGSNEPLPPEGIEEALGAALEDWRATCKSTPSPAR